MCFSEQMLALREQNGLTQEQAAKEIGIAYRSYRRYEAGEREPGVTALIKIADYYGVTIDYLVGRTSRRE